jgi:hypothetical protein
MPQRIKEVPEEIREWLEYNPHTGDLIWLKSRGKAKAGAAAGTLINHGYLQLRFMEVNYRCHRVAWFLHHGVQPYILDHVNNVKTDNRLANLQEVTDQENLILARIRNGKGVCWCNDKSHKAGGFYRATWGTEIMYQGLNEQKARRIRHAREQGWLEENPHIRME